MLPYAHALRLLPAYLQQLEMESNGKRVDRAGRPWTTPPRRCVWGAEGTPSQHSFHQLLHQGTQAGARGLHRRRGRAPSSTANAEAQADALAFGTDDPRCRRTAQQPGNRPSSILRLAKLDARNLGRLLAACTSTRCSRRACSGT